jgi:hypothetical protein
MKLLRTFPAARAALVLCPLLLASGWAGATDITSKQYIGDMREAQGRILMDRGGREVFARRGMRVFKKDTIRATSDASGAVVFRDETSLRFGPDTTVSLDDFEYTPEQKNFLLHSGVAKGVAVVVTGAIAKSAPETMAFTTPKGTIGIRGTKFTIKVEE